MGKRYLLAGAALFLAASLRSQDTATITVAAESPQPAGHAANRWMPFWLDVRGTCDLVDPSDTIHGFELWLAFDNTKVAFDLEGDGSTDDFSFSGTICNWPGCTGEEAPDQSYVVDVDVSGQHYLHVGVVFDSDNSCAKSLAEFTTEQLLMKIRLHALNATGDTDLGFFVGGGGGAGTPESAYFVKYQSGGVPGAVTATPTDLTLALGNESLFIRGNATGDATTDPLPDPPADPTIEIDLNDGLRVLQHLFVDATANPITCMESADANDDAKVNLIDGVYILQYVFGNAADFPDPLSHAGIDDDGDALGCAGSQR